jgi:hypothetical protein
MKLEPMTRSDYERIYQYVKMRMAQDREAEEQHKDALHERVMQEVMGDHGQG